MRWLTRASEREDGRPEAAGGVAPRHVAFLSYSHADESIGHWLHRRLESYIVPAPLVGREGPNGVVGKRLGRVFRDRTDLSASDDLGRDIHRALEAADALIVLCSRRSARSPYVNEEIRRFKELGKTRHIFAAIVDGEPHAASKPGHTADEECFPKALLNQLSSDGQVSGMPEAAEPIAADFREGKDGRAGAALKIIAGLLGVGLDELVQREKEAERKRRIRAYTIAAAVSVLAAGTLAASVIAYGQRELAIGRSLAVSAQALAQEDGDSQRDVLAALAVEAVKRIPPDEGASLAANLAPRIGQDIVFDGAEGERLSVQFIAGRDELAAVGFGTGLHLLDLASGRTRKVDSTQLGANADGAPLSSFGHRDVSGHYLAVESHAGKTFIVDTGTLRVTALPAEGWSTRFSDDSRFVAAVFSDNDRKNKLIRFGLLRLDRQEISLGEWEGNGLAYVDGSVALLHKFGRLLVVRSNNSKRTFAGGDNLEINEVTSDGRNAYLALAKRQPPLEVPEVSPPTIAPDQPAKVPAQAALSTMETPLKLAKGAATGVYRMNLEHGAVDRVLPVQDPVAIQLSPDKKWLFGVGRDGVCRRQLESDQVRCNPLPDAGAQCSNIRCTEIVSNSRWLAVHTKSGWQLSALQDERQFLVAQEYPNAAFLPAASPLALLVGERDLVLVDLESQQIRARLPGGNSPEQVALNDKGDLLAFSENGKIRVARLDPKALAAHLCTQPGRNLDKMQWARYVGNRAWQSSCPEWK
jgi:hypothetical protein